MRREQRRGHALAHHVGHHQQQRIVAQRHGVVEIATDLTRALPAAGEAEYTLFMQNNTESSGLTKYDGKEPSDPKPGWLMYIQVANVEEASLQAVKNGGKLLKAPYDATRIGRLSIIRDPDGNTVGLFTPPPKPAKE